MMHINTVANLEDIDIREAVKEYLVKRGLEVKSTDDVAITVSAHLPLLFSATVKVENKVLHEDKLRKPYLEPCQVCGETQYLDAPSTPGSEGTVRCPNANQRWHVSKVGFHAFKLDTLSEHRDCLVCGRDAENRIHRVTKQAGEQGAGTV